MNLFISFFTQYAGTIMFIFNIAFFAILVALVFGNWGSKKIAICSWFIFALVFGMLHAVASTSAQFLLWKQSNITRELVTIPLAGDVPRMIIHTPILFFADKIGGYYLFYAYTKFWVPLIFAIVCEGVVYALFLYLRKRNPIAVDKNEVILASGVAFLSGWPNVLLFIIGVFLITFVRAVVANTRSGSAVRTTLMPGIIIAGIITLVAGVPLGTLIGMDALVF